MADKFIGISRKGGTIVSLTISTDRTTLLAEARQEWLQYQQSREQLTGKKAETTAPVDQVLIAEDAALRAELAKLTDDTATLVTAATKLNVLA